MTSHRALKPYPPAGIGFTDTSGAGGGLVISWANRNRTNGIIRKQTDATDDPEDGQTTTVRIYKADTTTLLHTETGVTGTSYTYDDATEISEAGSLQPELFVKLKAVRDGYESLDQTAQFVRGTTVVVGSATVRLGASTVIVG